MHISIPYGKTHLDLNLADGLDVTLLSPRETEPASDPARAVVEALDTVEWSRYAGLKTAAIAVNDKTRPVPHHLLLPPLAARLESIGIEKITFVIATGCHTPMKPEEFGTVLPAEIIARHRVISHNVDDEDNIIRLGMTKQRTVVSVNRAYFDANLRLVVGNIEPHQFAGFSGGVKTAAIGLSGWDTINGNHRLMTEPGATLGSYDDNPLRQDIEDMGRVIGVNIALNTVLNGNKEIVRVFAGPPLNVIRTALPLVRQVYELPVEQPFDLVIAAPGGHPKDINIYQSQKALGHASLVTRRGGAVILAAACPDGAGSVKYEKWVSQFEPIPGQSREVIDRFRADGFSIGPHKAFQIARDSIDRRVIWITDIPQPERFLLEAAPSFDDALKRVPEHLRGRIGVIPYANATIPALVASRSGH